MNDLLLGSTISALATGAGAVPIFLFKNMHHRTRDLILAFTAGVMVAAISFSLIPASLDSSNFMTVAIGVLLGVAVLSFLEGRLPHIDLEHSKKQIAVDNKTLLIMIALVLHNVPEGASVGFSYASHQEDLGPLIALAIGLQNAPEGLLVALFLVTQQIPKMRALWLATLTGAVEIPSAILGYLLSSILGNIVPVGLSFAAGAMLFIVYKELIPESHGDGHERSSTYSFIIGLLVMLYLVNYF